MPVHNGANEQLNCGLCHKESVCGKNATDSTIEHASEKSHSRAVTGPGVHEFKHFGAGNDGDDQNSLSNHPENKLLPLQKHEQLVEIMSRFSNSSE